jgi:hypothetical protein
MKAWTPSRAAQALAPRAPALSPAYRQAGVKGEEVIYLIFDETVIIEFDEPR